MKKYLAVGVGVALVLGFLGLFFPRSQPVTQTVVEKVVETVRDLGAIPGNSIEGEELIVGGIKTYYLGPEKGTSVASTTPCTVRTPNATTSAQSLSLRWNSDFATTTGTKTQIVTIATSTVRNATTSVIWQSRVTVGRPLEITIFATSSAEGTSNYVFPPNTFVNVGISGKDAVSLPGGSCLRIQAQEL